MMLLDLPYKTHWEQHGRKLRKCLSFSLFTHSRVWLGKEVVVLA